MELADDAPKNLQVCVENDRLSKIVIEALEETLPSGKLFLTWDIPKSCTADGRPMKEVEDFFNRHLDKIRECHIHDQKPGKPSHDAVGAGSIRFHHYLRILVPMEVFFTIEVRPREAALKSLQRLERMLHTLGCRISPI